MIAGVRALGSVGAVDYLVRHLRDLYAQVGTSGFSMVIRSTFDGETLVESELACPLGYTRSRGRCCALVTIHRLPAISSIALCMRAFMWNRRCRDTDAQAPRTPMSAPETRRGC